MKQFDYIIVGAGTAGCVLADRLSADGQTVLVLEAGGSDDDLMVKVPALFSGMFQGPNDWNYNSDPEPGLHGRRVYLPRGKMLGGSSSMNAMFYMRGTREDYDGWAHEFGATGWSYDEVLPYFKRSENNADIRDEFHGTQGPLHVTTQRWLSPHAEPFIEAAVAAGIERNDDFNGAQQAGAGLLQVNTHNGRRDSSADAFLRPALERDNVELIMRAMVRRVIIEDGKAVGVEYERDGQIQSVYADGEVVLSAGAYNSPQILMLSGVGPADHLREVGIEPIVDSPNVGQHLQDHPFTILQFDTPQDVTLSKLADPAHMAQWQADQTGMMTTNAGEAAVMWRSQADLPSPDFQIIFVPGWFWDHGFRRPSRPGMSIGLSYNGPSSRGSVRLRSGDYRDAPRIVSNLLSQDHEVEAVSRAIGLVEAMVSQKPLADVLGERVNPGPGIGREQLPAWIRAETQHMYHAASTCRIGSPETGVVDAALRVHGVENLRVADASIMPRISSGNTHAPTLMIGEVASDLILGRKAAAKVSLEALV